MAENNVHVHNRRCEGRGCTGKPNAYSARAVQTPEQPESPALRSLADFLDGRSIGTLDGNYPPDPDDTLRLRWVDAGLVYPYGDALTEAETSTVLALFALVALEWVAR